MLYPAEATLGERTHLRERHVRVTYSCRVRRHTRQLAGKPVVGAQGNDTHDFVAQRHFESGGARGGYGLLVRVSAHGAF